MRIKDCFLVLAVKRKKAILSDSEDEEQVDAPGECSSTVSRAVP